MTWIRSEDVRAGLERRWRRGDLLRAMVDGDSPFPMRFPAKPPSSAELAAGFKAVREWIGELSAMRSARIEWKEQRDRVLGRQRLPAAIWIDTLDDALDWLGKHDDVRAMVRLVSVTRARRPSALAWIARQPFRALELSEDWERILDVACWLDAHPASGLYARQIDLPGMHSKFVERYLGVLQALLALGVDAATSAADLGLAQKPIRIRFRILDPGMSVLDGTRCPDVTLDAASFADMAIKVEHVFITENEINFLAFPRRAASIVVFGAGYGWEALSRTGWLRACQLHYWGDIDTHGFAILDGLRKHFPEVRSLLMDRATLFRHIDSWVEEAAPLTRELSRLTTTEAALFEELRRGDLRHDGASVRLEQERIGFGSLVEALVERGVPAPLPD